MGGGEGTLGGRAEAQNESISCEGRVRGSPSLAPKVIHFAPGEGLRDDEGGGGVPSSHTLRTVHLAPGEGQARGGSVTHTRTHRHGPRPARGIARAGLCPHPSLSQIPSFFYCPYAPPPGMAAMAAAAARCAASATAMALATAARSAASIGTVPSERPSEPLAAAFLPGLIVLQSCCIRLSAARALSFAVAAAERVEFRRCAPDPHRNLRLQLCAAGDEGDA